MTGFVMTDSSVWARPVGVAVAHDGALLVTEDGNGAMWRACASARTVSESIGRPILSLGTSSSTACMIEGTPAITMTLPIQKLAPPTPC